MKGFDIIPLRTAYERLMPLARKYRAVLIVLLAGMVLLVSGGWFGGADTAARQTANETAEQGFDLAAFERTLHDKLAAIEGVGRVDLMLSLKESEEAVYAVNVRRTQNSETAQSYESNLTVLSDGSYGETPVTVKRMLPTFRGAVVLCDGADDAAVRLAVTQAVGTVCGIGSDKVTVLKMAPET